MLMRNIEHILQTGYQKSAESCWHYCQQDSALFETETNLYNRSVLYAYSPRSTAKTVAIATKVAVRFENFNINLKSATNRVQWKFRSCHRRCVPCHYKDIRTSESVGFYYIDNQTLCISIPRWHLWFELKEHQMFRKLRNNLKIVRSLLTISNCFFLFLGPIIAVSLTNVRMIWTKPCSLQERHGKITLFIVQEFHKSCSFQFSGNPIATISIFGYSSNRTFILLRKVFDGLIMFKRY